MDRRTFLKATGGVSVASLGVTTGCLGILGGGGTYRSWLPAPGELGDTEHYQFTRIAPKTVANRDDEIGDDAYQRLVRFASILEPLGIDFDQLNSVVSGEGFTAFTGEYDTEEVKDDVQDELYDADDDDHEGFTIYTPEGGSEAFAVGDQGLVWSSTVGDDDAKDVAEAVIDAKVGKGTRYGRESDAMKVLLDTLGDAPYVSAETHAPREETVPEGARFEDAVGWGVTANPGPDDTSVTWGIVFDSSDAVASNAVQTWADEALGDYDGVSVSTSGRVATASGSVPTDQFRTYRLLPASGPIYRQLQDPRQVYDVDEDNFDTTTVEYYPEEGAIIWGPTHGGGRGIVAGRVVADGLEWFRPESAESLDRDTGSFTSRFSGGQDGIEFDPDSLEGFALRTFEAADLVVDGETVAEDARIVRYVEGEGVVQQREA